MKTQMKIAVFGIVVLLLAACGPVQPVTGREPIDSQNPVATIVGSEVAAGPEPFGKYIGLNYSQTPNGLSNDVSMLIQDAEDHGLFVMSDGAYKMLWLSKMTHRDADGNAFWEVKDVLDLSTVGAGMQLFLDGCTLNGVPDSEIFVAGKDGTISLAWRANTASNLFEVIPPYGIECHTDKIVDL